MNKVFLLLALLSINALYPMEKKQKHMRKKSEDQSTFDCNKYIVPKDPDTLAVERMTTAMDYENYITCAKMQRNVRLSVEYPTKYAATVLDSKNTIQFLEDYAQKMLSDSNKPKILKSDPSSHLLQQRADAMEVRVALKMINFATTYCDNVPSQIAALEDFIKATILKNKQLELEMEQLDRESFDN